MKYVSYLSKIDKETEKNFKMSLYKIFNLFVEEIKSEKISEYVVQSVNKKYIQLFENTFIDVSVLICREVTLYPRKDNINFKIKYYLPQLYETHEYAFSSLGEMIGFICNRIILNEEDFIGINEWIVSNI